MGCSLTLGQPGRRPRQLGRRTSTPVGSSRSRGRAPGLPAPAAPYKPVYSHRNSSSPIIGPVLSETDDQTPVARGLVLHGVGWSSATTANRRWRGATQPFTSPLWMFVAALSPARCTSARSSRRYCRLHRARPRGGDGLTERTRRAEPRYRGGVGTPRRLFALSVSRAQRPCETIE